MQLSSTQLVFPWNLGSDINNSTDSGYQIYTWTPSTLTTLVIIIIMVLVTLMPAVCSVCYHIYYWIEKRDHDDVDTVLL